MFVVFCFVNCDCLCLRGRDFRVGNGYFGNVGWGVVVLYLVFWVE